MRQDQLNALCEQEKLSVQELKRLAENKLLTSDKWVALENLIAKKEGRVSKYESRTIA